jgi:hypothetical protein
MCVDGEYETVVADVQGKRRFQYNMSKQLESED